MDRLDMTKNGAQPGWSRTRNSHLKALQFVSEGIVSCGNWAHMQSVGIAHKFEAQRWLKAHVVFLVKEILNPHCTMKLKVRPIALTETPLKLTESVAVQVEFRVRDGAEAMIGAVRSFLNK